MKKDRGTFYKLTPNNNIENFDNNYSDIFEFIFKNDDITNIAITGDLGTGKSSVLKTLQNKHNNKHRFIIISLLYLENKFKNDTPFDSVEKNTYANLNDLELSILQQILFKVDAIHLPYSKFERISNISKDTIQENVLTLIPFVASIVIFILFKEYSLMLSLGWVLFCISLPFILFKLIKINYSKYQVKKVGFNNLGLEIRSENKEKESYLVFNNHIDEFIYFFQATDYDVICIEDLDRFRNTDIFLKLKELNTLINSNENIKRPIRFIYAIKDDLFTESTDRVKFFDIIVPTIPYISGYNAFDKLYNIISEDNDLNVLTNMFLTYDIQILINRYFQDIRLVYNILNEFKIYKNLIQNIKDSDYSLEFQMQDLFFIIAYKNLYPSDFQNFYRGVGALAKFNNEKVLKSNALELKNNCPENFIQKLYSKGIFKFNFIRLINYIHPGYFTANDNMYIQLIEYPEPSILGTDNTEKNLFKMNIDNPDRILTYIINKFQIYNCSIFLEGIPDKERDFIRAILNINIIKYLLMENIIFGDSKYTKALVNFAIQGIYKNSMSKNFLLGKHVFRYILRTSYELKGEIQNDLAIIFLEYVRTDIPFNTDEHKKEILNKILNYKFDEKFDIEESERLSLRHFQKSLRECIIIYDKSSNFYSILKDIVLDNKDIN